MRIDITPGATNRVGPPGGSTETIPASANVTITDTVPYDVEVWLKMNPTVGKLVVRKVCCTALPGGDDVSPLGIAHIALRDTIQTALETECLGGTGRPGLLDKHRQHDPLALDALIYLLAVAFQSPKPTATVAPRPRIVSGQRPQAVPVLAARKAGLLPETEPGKPAGHDRRIEHGRDRLRRARPKPPSHQGWSSICWLGRSRLCLRSSGAR